MEKGARRSEMRDGAAGLRGVAKRIAPAARDGEMEGEERKGSECVWGG